MLRKHERNVGTLPKTDTLSFTGASSVGTLEKLEMDTASGSFSLFRSHFQARMFEQVGIVLRKSDFQNLHSFSQFVFSYLLIRKSVHTYSFDDST